MLISSYCKYCKYFPRSGRVNDKAFHFCGLKEVRRRWKRRFGIFYDFPRTGRAKLQAFEFIGLKGDRRSQFSIIFPGQEVPNYKLFVHWVKQVQVEVEKTLQVYSHLILTSVSDKFL